MSKEDEILQQQVEAGQQPQGRDGEAYAKVFHALAMQPDNTLPPAFAERVIQRVLALKQEKESRRDTWWLAFGIFLLTLVFIIAFAFVGFKMNLGFLRVVGDFKWLFLCAGVLLAIFNVIDRKLVRPTVGI
jgi:hypothetical protein